jgi:OPA family sugar phosphate sensor protein UhpC-like MFS transporter
MTAAHRVWRIKIFVATWLSYVGFYFCRKHWNAAKAAIETQNGWDLATTAGNVGAAYLIGYACGQFLASGLGTRLGARTNLLLGMGISIVIALALSITGSPWIFGGLMAILGVAQATGWSGNVGTMANWFHKHERGKVMGWWSTNFTVGSIVTGFVFALVLGDVGPAQQPWQRCFWVGAAILTIVWIQFYYLQRNRPEDVGLPGIDDPATEIDESKLIEPEDTSFTREQWINILLVGGFYFCAKLIRYAVWSWASYFLQTKFHKSGEDANIYSIAFEICGVPGIILTGWLSDRYFNSKRAGVALMMMLGMCIVTVLLLAWGDTSATVFTVLLGGVGFFLLGPDALLSGAGAMDVGSRKVAVRATGIICGFGALGPIVQEVIIPRVYDQKTAGLGPVFVILLVAAGLGAAFCAALAVRNRINGKGI